MPSKKRSTVVERLDALNEFDREPVAEDRLQGPGSFIGLYPVTEPPRPPSNEIYQGRPMRRRTHAWADPEIRT